MTATDRPTDHATQSVRRGHSYVLRYGLITESTERDLGHCGTPVMCQTTQRCQVLLERHQIVRKHRRRGNRLLISGRRRHGSTVALPHLSACCQQPITDEQLHRLRDSVNKYARLRLLEFCLLLLLMGTYGLNHSVRLVGV